MGFVRYESRQKLGKIPTPRTLLFISTLHVSDGTPVKSIGRNPHILQQEKEQRDGLREIIERCAAFTKKGGNAAVADLRCALAELTAAEETRIDALVKKA